MTLDLTRTVLLTVDEVCELFRHPGDRKWAYRMADRGWLRPHVRRFGRAVYFDKSGIERLISGLDP